MKKVSKANAAWIERGENEAMLAAYENETAMRNMSNGEVL